MTTPPPASALDYHAILQEADGAFGPPSPLPLHDFGSPTHHGHDHDHDHDHVDDGEGDGEYVPIITEGTQSDIEQVLSASLPNDHDETGEEGDQGDGTRINKKALSVPEKKARLRAQNKKAAEKSRVKKRGEVSILETSVDNLREENAQLRQRLATLSGTRIVPSSEPTTSATVKTMNETQIDPILDSMNIESSTPPFNDNINALAATTHGDSSGGIGIDYTYLSKLQNELSTAKSTLFDKQLEIQRLIPNEEVPSTSTFDRPHPSLESSEEVKLIRQQIFGSASKASGLEVESKSLNAMLDHLRKEVNRLARQREGVQAELDKRKGTLTIPVDAAERRTGVPQELDNEGQSNEVNERDEPTTTTGVETEAQAVLITGDNLVGESQAIATTAESVDVNAHQEASTTVDTAAPDAGVQGEGEEEIEMEMDEGAVDSNILDIRGWIDAAVKEWDQQT